MLPLLGIRLYHNYMKRFLIILGFIAIVISSCGKEVSVNPEEAPPSKGFIYIETIPSGAKIYLNGNNTGRVTPDSIRWLPEGETQFRLKLENYRDSVFNHNIKESERAHLVVDFINNPYMRGRLICKTTPDQAEILINDSLTENKTPFEFKNLIPGKYKIKYNKYGCWSDSVIVTVRSGESTYADKKLPDSTVWVIYNRTNSKLPSNYLNHMLIVDSTIWLASSDSGLIRYSNGKYYSFNRFNSPLPDNIIYRILKDNNNNLWIATYSAGLVKYDGVSWTVYNKNNSKLPDNEIRAMGIDKTGKVWVGTYEKGLAVFDNNDWKIYTKENSGISSNLIKSIAFDENNIVWIGTFNAGVNKFDGENWESFDMIKSGFPSNNIESIFVEGNKIWLGMGVFGKNYGGIAYYNGSSWSSFMGMPSKSVVSIYSDDKNDLWMATSDGIARLAKPDALKEMYRTNNSPVPVNNITSVFIDKNNLKWITTAGGGLIKYKGE